MRHVASRLVRYADDNKIIHVDAILDVALLRLSKDKTINPKIRSALKSIDNQLELLIPRQVDNRESQFKRYLQNQFGLVINLSELSKKYPSKYRKLQVFGSPAEVITRWGLDYTYDRNLEVKDFKRLLGGHSDGQQVIRRLNVVDIKLYSAITHQARKEGLTFKEYVERLGFRSN